MKAVLQIVLWVVIVFLGYMIYNAIQAPIKFNKIKKERYIPVIEKLKDIRQSELAYKDVNGKYSGNFDSLVSFIDTAQFVITQRRDTSYLDKKFKKTYDIDKYIQDVIVDTLGHRSVKDSLFKNSDRYKTMMYIPGMDKKEKFDLKADSVYRNEEYIPVFQVRVEKELILKGLNKNMISREKKIKSVDDINGPYIQVGSLDKVNDNGNWPKNYADEKEK